MSKWTTQAELLELADKHQNNVTVRNLCVSLKELRTGVQTAHAQMEAYVATQRRALAGDDGFSVSLDNSHLMTAAAKACAALTSMSHIYMVLASALTELGENISY